MSNDIQPQLDAKWDECQRVVDEYYALCRAAGRLTAVADYPLRDFEGKEVKLSQAFGEQEQLVLIHNMGFHCSYCTLWADGFNGIWRHCESGEYGSQAKFLLVSNDTPEQQRAGALQRGWTMPMLSCRGTSLFADLGFVGEDGQSWWPGASILVKQADGRISRQAKAVFGPGDTFCSLFSFFALLPRQAGATTP